MKNRKPAPKWIRLFIIVLAIPLIIGAAYSGLKVNNYTLDYAEVKTDFSEINDIYYGLLSVDKWEVKIKEIASYQIQNFSLTPEQDSLLRIEISEILHGVITTSKNMINNNTETLKEKIRKLAVNTFVDEEKIRAKVPSFTNAIIEHATTPESMDRIEKLALSKIDEFASETYDGNNGGGISKYCEKYEVETHQELNSIMKKNMENLEQKAQKFMQIQIGIVILFLLFWFIAYRKPKISSPFMLLSVILGLVVLITGVTTPMLEIDARIRSIEFVLLGQNIQFEDQTIFYRSKSILEMVWILFETKKGDAFFVGFLILAFSVLLPTFKIISMGFYLLSKKFREAKLTSWMVYKSGKWSMADVIVVAIFMSYVAFDGILKNQLQTFEKSTANMNAITTNETALAPGFFIFLTYVLFSLILSALLKGILKRDKKTA